MAKKLDLLQLIRDMLRTSESDKKLAERYRLPLDKIKRYRLAVVRFYGETKI